MRYREAKVASLLLVRADLGFKYRSARCKSPCWLLSVDTDPGLGGHNNKFGRFHGFGVSGSLLRRLQKNRRWVGLQGRCGKDGMKNRSPAEVTCWLSHSPGTRRWRQLKWAERLWGSGVCSGWGHEHSNHMAQMLLPTHMTLSKSLSRSVLKLHRTKQQIYARQRGGRLWSRRHPLATPNIAARARGLGRADEEVTGSLPRACAWSWGTKGKIPGPIAHELGRL